MAPALALALLTDLAEAVSDPLTILEIPLMLIALAEFMLLPRQMLAVLFTWGPGPALARALLIDLAEAVPDPLTVLEIPLALVAFAELMLLPRQMLTALLTMLLGGGSGTCKGHGRQ